MLVGSGLRISELSGLAVRGPHGLSDVMLDSLERGRAELRVRWDAGARVARPGVHAHGFRHTFATVATQMGWNLERVRAAMGHADYSVLQRYVCLSAERDLGPKTA